MYPHLLCLPPNPLAGFRSEWRSGPSTGYQHGQPAPLPVMQLHLMSKTFFFIMSVFSFLHYMAVLYFTTTLDFLVLSFCCQFFFYLTFLVLLFSMLPVQLGDSLLFLIPNPMYWDIFSPLKPYPERGISLGLRPGVRAFSIPPATPSPATSVICFLLASLGYRSEVPDSPSKSCAVGTLHSKQAANSVTFPSGSGLTILSTLLCSPGFSGDPPIP